LLGHNTTFAKTTGEAPGPVLESAVSLPALVPEEPKKNAVSVTGKPQIQLVGPSPAAPGPSADPAGAGAGAAPAGAGVAGAAAGAGAPAPEKHPPEKEDPQRGWCVRSKWLVGLGILLLVGGCYGLFG